MKRLIGMKASIERREFMRRSFLLGMATAGLGTPGILKAQATVNVRDYGAAGDGVNNDTGAFRNAIAAVPAGGTVLVPSGHYMLNADAVPTYGVRLKSNMRLELLAGAKLQAFPNALERHYLLWIDGKENVEISSDVLSPADMPEIIGERDDHIGAGGEWGQGIRVEGSSNVVIKNLRISNFWGDGITIGRLDSDFSPSRNVMISGVQSRNNRRQGLSIISAIGIDVLNSEFSYTNGAPPQAGIDIEPDIGGEVRSTFIGNCVISHNSSNGVEINGMNGLIDDVEIRGCRISHNGIAGISGSGIHSQRASGVWVVQNPEIRNNYNRGVYVAASAINHTIQGNRFTTNRVGTFPPSPSPACVGPVTGEAQASLRHVEVRSGAQDIQLIDNTYCD